MAKYVADLNDINDILTQLVGIIESHSKEAWNHELWSLSYKEGMSDGLASAAKMIRNIVVQFEAQMQGTSVEVQGQ